MEIFAGASGLTTNMSKCLISPIQCDLEATVKLLTNFPGMIDPFPIKYLGIPLGLRRLSKAALQPLVDKVANKLPSWKANLMNHAGRTVLIKSTLSAIPTHTAHAVSLSTWAIKCIDNISRPKVGSAFWLGPEFVARLNWVVRASLTCSASDMRCA